MKNFTRIVTISLVMLLSVFSASGQTKWIKEKAQTEADKISTALSLDEEMSTKIHDIQLAMLVKIRAINTEAKAENITTEEKKEQAKVVRQTANKDIEAILGKDLTKEYRIYRKAQRAKNQK